MSHTKVRKFNSQFILKIQQDATVYIYFLFIWSSTCFGRHTAHHQEPKTAPAASDFAYVEGCWTCSCWTLSGRELHIQQPSTYTKPEAASAVLGSWWWAVCRPKHVQLHINMKKIDSLLHLVGLSLWIIVQGPAEVPDDLAKQLSVEPLAWGICPWALF